MARIPYPDQTKLPPEVSELLQQAHLKIFSMWAHSANTIGLIMNLGAAQFVKLELPRAIREMVTLLGASANSAEYEWVQHVAPSKAAGVSDAQRAALRRGDVDALCFSPAEQAALRLTAAVQAGPEVADSIFDAARRYLSDRQLVELVGLVGYYWMLGRIATVFQVELDVAQGTEVYDAGLKVAARSQQKAVGG
jgi:alkylhydroperoxidase family enzyme